MAGLAALLVLCLAAQQPRDQPRTPPAGTGVIRGRVVRADTGEPLRRALVSVDQWSTADGSGPASTMTGPDGRYELTQLPKGRYMLRATRGGFVDMSYGQKRPFEPGRPIELDDGAVLQNVDFTLPAGGVVTGRVVDETGEPVAQVSVSLARRRYVDGEKQLAGQTGASTDDRGEFRIFGVPPGDYFAIARFEMFDFGSRDRVRYVPTYYPGTAAVSEAQRITVAPAQEVGGITIPLARASTVTVRGIIRPSGKAAVGPFTFVSAREIGVAPTESRMTQAIAKGDGSFTLTGLLPGTYLLEAQSMSASAYGSTEVTVAGSDVGDVAVVLSEGAAVRGRIRFDTGTPPKTLRPSEVFVMPVPLDRHTGAMSTREGPPTVHDDWSFELHGLRGRGFIHAGALSDWHMKRVRRGDVDVTDIPLDFSSDIDDLEIELTERVTKVSGAITDDRGKPALDATVVVFAEDAGKWIPHSRFIGSARPNQEGTFSIDELPPGKYVAIALEYLEPGEERDPERLEQWRQRGTRFTLVEGETHTVDLKLSGS